MHHATRIALLSDIHANEVALDAVLTDATAAGVDAIACLGDVATLGPRPREVVAKLRLVASACVLGNHDEFLLDPPLARSYTRSAEVLEAIDWCRAQLSDEDLEFLQSFRAGVELSLPGEVTLALFHGSPRSHTEDLLATTPSRELDERLAGCTARVMAGGHTHVQMLRQHRGALLVNPGSVGLPFLEHVSGRAPTILDHAEYAVVEAGDAGVTVSLRRVSLDRIALRDAARASDNPICRSLERAYA